MVSEPCHLGLYLSHCMALTVPRADTGVSLISPLGWKCPGRAWRSVTPGRWRAQQTLAELRVPELKGPQQHGDKQGLGETMAHSDKEAEVGGQQERGEGTKM